MLHSNRQIGGFSTDEISILSLPYLNHFSELFTHWLKKVSYFGVIGTLVSELLNLSTFSRPKHNDLGYVCCNPPPLAGKQ